MAALLDELVGQGVLRDSRIRNAFQTVDRALFLPATIRDAASANAALPVGYGQTISQPFTVAFMLDLLKPQPGESVLDVGVGSGWAAALLATLVSPDGTVYAVERIPELLAMAQRNLQTARITNIVFEQRDGSQGWSAHAPYACIHVAAAAPAVPSALRDQLAIGGRLVIPVGGAVQDLVYIRRITAADYEESRFPGFQFVPLIENNLPL